MSVKKEEDPQGFLDMIEKIFHVMHAMNIEGVDFTTNQLKDVVYYGLRNEIRQGVTLINHHCRRISLMYSWTIFFLGVEGIKKRMSLLILKKGRYWSGVWP